jgi:phenylpyruvate tautomerase PptA (4-oxalocrotonate tautomerase family)
MPIVHIYLKEGKTGAYVQDLGDKIHQTLMETWGIPKNDKFQIFHEKKPEHFNINAYAYLEDDGVQRTDDVVVIQISTSPRTIHQKQAFYRRLPELLKESSGLSPANVFVNILMVDEEDWCLGLGKMTLIDRLR